MRTSLHTLLFVTLLSLVPFGAGAAVVALEAILDGGQANAGSGTGSSGTGFAQMSLDTGSLLFNWNASWSGLSGPATAAHFHGPATPTQNASVQVGIDHTSNPSVGSTMLSQQQADDLLAGLWYLNIHTALNPGGEIRGQVQVVPLPAAFWLLASGLLGLIACGRRRFRA